ncbi:Atg14 domain-containing protein [Aspergillus tanneri]|uniref:Autophagy-related protein 14 n=1 Tax=Aspergillus tanneri TaxID=1220188 RepID=A0A5M9M9N0_9EURO|nr:uncharacterized protein ATNIH1004_011131 [Aspergillus tanneri]KAA8642190.1 hypothetical protein ATNIH1004_011131 [Aspergillus tanneri]
MSCHVCSRAPTSHIQYFCPICARNRLYQLHNENVRILIESESIARQIEDAVKIGNYRDVLSDKYEKLSNNNKDTQLKFWIKQTISNQQSKSFPRAKILAIQVEKLRLEIENKRLEISQRKLALKRRYSDAESAKYQLVEREAAILAGVQNSTKRTDHLWHSQHSKTAEARIFLCREAANIYGLCQVAKKKNGEFKETYCIGGVSICNLKDMNGKL